MANNTKIPIDMDESYGLKLNYLVQGYTKFIQQLLKTRCVNLSDLISSSDFSPNCSSLVWTNEEQEKIHLWDIEKWDISFCSKLLLELSDLFEPPINQFEQIAIRDLRNVRNETKHAALMSHIDRMEFKNKCAVVEKALNTLNANPKTITAIFEGSTDRVSIDKSKILEILPPWKFETEKILGSGSYGIVISAKDQLDGEIYAVKIIPNQESEMSQTYKDYLFRETSNLAKLSKHHDHPNVVKYKTTEQFLLPTEKFKEILLWNKMKDTNVVSTETKTFLGNLFYCAKECGNTINGLYIKTEICGESLRQWLDVKAGNAGDLEYVACLNFGKQITKGLNFIHSQKIIHRDLHPKNIFFANPKFQHHLKIGDFGLSKQTELYKSQISTKDAGNNLYQAPEVKKEHKDGKAIYCQAADLYSLGLIFAELFEPVTCANLHDKFGEITFSRNTGPKIRFVPKLDQLILKLTEKEPKERYTLDCAGNPRTIEIPLENSDVQNLTQWKNENSSSVVKAFGDLQLKSKSNGVLIVSNERPQTSSSKIGVRFTSTHAESDINLLGNPSTSALKIGTTKLPFNVSEKNLPTKTFTPRSTSPEPSSSNSVLPTCVSLTNSHENSRANRNTTKEMGEKGIIYVRKKLRGNQSFWTSYNVAKFFSELEGVDISINLANFKELTGKQFNSKIYGLPKIRPGLLTEQNIMRALSAAGFSALADSIKESWPNS